MKRVLMIEDEPGILLTVGDRLRAEGFAFQGARDGRTGLGQALEEPHFDLILLDLMLPELDGMEVCRELRRRGVETPVLMLTARGEVRDRVAGLRLGADDYLVKPFDPEELLARIEALLRRTPERRGDVVRFGEVAVDLRAMEVTRADEIVVLSALEFQLLAYLIAHENVVVPRDELLREVWGFQRPPRTRTVDVHMTWLRSKLEPDRGRPRYLRTVRGAGYKFVRSKNERAPQL